MQIARVFLCRLSSAAILSRIDVSFPRRRLSFDGSRPPPCNARTCRGLIGRASEQRAVPPGEDHRGIGRADRNTCPPMTGCRVPQVVKERRTARLKGGHVMNADHLKKLTTESLKQLASMLDEGHSE